jgi:proteasome lid subunit RPN8/RPN11
MLILIEEQAWKVINEDAENTYPYECCGFLYGYEEEGKRTITKADPVNNAKDENQQRRFEITTEDYMQAEEYADNNDLLLLGIYHSHPDHPAVPSNYDLRKALPFFSYVIASVKKAKVADLKSWQLDENRQFQEEDLNISAENFNLDQFLTVNE